MDKPNCLEGQAHHWIFPTGTGSTKIFGPRRSGGVGFYDASAISINYKRTATCKICDQTYTFENIKSPYVRPLDASKNGRKRRAKHKKFTNDWIIERKKSEREAKKNFEQG